MHYPTPKTVLTYLASHGSSATQLEALRLLGLLTCPGDWPACPRRSRLALLRILAANPKKSASARLEAFKQLFAGHFEVPLEIDEEVRRLLNEAGPRPETERQCPETERGPEPAPSVAKTETRPQPETKRPETERTPERVDPPQAWQFAVEPPSEDASRLVARLARERYRQTFDVLHWDALSRGLAAQRQKPKRQRLYGMPTCGDELND
jgi:hypothetical protein